MFRVVVTEFISPKLPDLQKLIVPSLTQDGLEPTYKFTYLNVERIS